MHTQLGQQTMVISDHILLEAAASHWQDSCMIQVMTFPRHALLHKPDAHFNVSSWSAGHIMPVELEELLVQPPSCTLVFESPGLCSVQVRIPSSRPIRAVRDSIEQYCG